MGPRFYDGRTSTGRGHESRRHHPAGLHTDVRRRGKTHPKGAPSYESRFPRVKGIRAPLGRIAPENPMIALMGHRAARPTQSRLDRRGHVGNMARPFGGLKRRERPSEAPRLTRHPQRTQGVPPMRFPLPLNPRADRFARGFALVALGAALAGLGGACADKHIGRPCQVDVPPADAGSASCRKPCANHRQWRPRSRSVSSAASSCTIAYSRIVSSSV